MPYRTVRRMSQTLSKTSTGFTTSAASSATSSATTGAATTSATNSSEASCSDYQRLGISTFLRHGVHSAAVREPRDKTRTHTDADLRVHLHLTATRVPLRRDFIVHQPGAPARGSTARS